MPSFGILNVMLLTPFQKEYCRIRAFSWTGVENDYSMEKFSYGERPKSLGWFTCQLEAACDKSM